MSNSFREVLQETGAFVELQSTTRDDALREMVQALADAGRIGTENVKAIGEALIERERKGTTGFGKGVAAPRGRHNSVPRLMTAVGISPEGLDFQSLDRRPVHIVCVILLREHDMEEEKIELEENMFRCMREETFRTRVMTAKSLMEVLRIIDECHEDDDA